MTQRERFLNVLDFKRPGDRLPILEWAAWWDKTIERWKGEGLPEDISWDDSLEYFGLDKIYCIGAHGASDRCPVPQSQSAGIITDEKSYEAIRPFLFTDSTLESLRERAVTLKERHDRG
ncbi:MAG: hypothetical protein Q7J78_01330, partial [Clostridiales bacterium]|nr:hypothetical protein [Clostridiales bacterium]